MKAHLRVAAPKYGAAYLASPEIPDFNSDDAALERSGWECHSLTAGQSLLFGRQRPEMTSPRRRWLQIGPPDARGAREPSEFERAVSAVVGEIWVDGVRGRVFLENVSRHCRIELHSDVLPASPTALEPVSEARRWPTDGSGQSRWLGNPIVALQPDLVRVDVVNAGGRMSFWVLVGLRGLGDAGTPDRGAVDPRRERPGDRFPEAGTTFAADLATGLTGRVAPDTIRESAMRIVLVHPAFRHLLVEFLEHPDVQSRLREARLTRSADIVRDRLTEGNVGAELHEVVMVGLGRSGANRSPRTLTEQVRRHLNRLDPPARGDDEERQRPRGGVGESLAQLASRVYVAFDFTEVELRDHLALPAPAAGR